MSDQAARGSAVTELLLRWRGGDRQALDALTPMVYSELHRIASRALSHERAGHTLQSTALVHEAFLRLVDQTRVDWQNRAQFFGLAAQLMRRILVDHARRTGSLKRGGEAVRIDAAAIDDVAGSAAANPADTLTIDTALRKLEALDPVQGRIVELRFFGGLTIEETADAMGVSPTTVKREWAVAKAWLFREVSGAGP